MDNRVEAFFALVKAGLWEKEVRLSQFEKIDFTNASNLKVIGEGFFNSTDFGSIYLPTSVTTIKKNAFIDNKPSTKLIVYYAGTEEDFNKITIDSSNNNHYTVIYQTN